MSNYKKKYDQDYKNVIFMNETYPYQIKHRKRTSKKQLEVLEKTFETCIRPDAKLRKKLGDQLGMTPRAVQIWFQNRRAKVKKATQKKPEVEKKKEIVETEFQPQTYYNNYYGEYDQQNNVVYPYYQPHEMYSGNEHYHPVYVENETYYRNMYDYDNKGYVPYDLYYKENNYGYNNYPPYYYMKAQDEEYYNEEAPQAEYDNEEQQ